MPLSFGKTILLINLVFFSSLSLYSQALDYLNVLDFFDTNVFKFDFNIENDVFTIENNKGYLKFRVGFEYALTSSGYYMFVDPIIDVRGEILISQKVLKQIENYFSSLKDYNKPRITSIIIDPGHGGHDAGAVVTLNINGYDVVLQEKDFALTYSIYLSKILSNYFVNKNILLTRINDVFLTLKERSEFANAIKPNFPNNVIFLSIHANDAPNSQARGVEFWYLPKDSKRKVIKDFKGYDIKDNRYLSELNDILDIKYKYESKRLAEILYKVFKNELSETNIRPIREEQWFVIKNSSMPAVLIEMGFLSNILDAKLILDYNYMSKFNILILKSLIEFINFYEK